METRNGMLIGLLLVAVAPAALAAGTECGNSKPEAAPDTTVAQISEHLQLAGASPEPAARLARAVVEHRLRFGLPASARQALRNTQGRIDPQTPPLRELEALEIANRFRDTYFLIGDAFSESHPELARPELGPCDSTYGQCLAQARTVWDDCLLEPTIARAFCLDFYTHLIQGCGESLQQPRLTSPCPSSLAGSPPPEPRRAPSTSLYRLTGAAVPRSERVAALFRHWQALFSRGRGLGEALEVLAIQAGSPAENALLAALDEAITIQDRPAHDNHLLGDSRAFVADQAARYEKRSRDLGRTWCRLHRQLKALEVDTSKLESFMARKGNVSISSEEPPELWEELQAAERGFEEEFDRCMNTGGEP